ncbi:hypothetical protein [Thioalkalivibrio sp. AKL7]|uniref:hypothetical protein n=1 Tax=Thioalkalivibrio sp. AKL7 TaxID=1158155 RepID=UPI0012DF2330|nr:hypothetical protein [Thioalkalivibrio sp. AKL7]
MSLAGADYGDSVPRLLISIEGGADQAVIDVAANFEWQGAKEVIVHHARRGLRNHILWCGDISLKYGGVILLEDDLFVSKYFYQYAKKVISHYECSRSSENIGSYSLYSFHLSESANVPFAPIDDGYDVYFLQACSSWGQVWTKRQWVSFKKWYSENKNLPVAVEDGLPFNVASWPETSWKKYFNKFMVVRGLHSVVPRVSLTTNFGDVGSHHDGSSKYQVPILLGAKRWAFPCISESRAVYDAFFEVDIERVLSKIKNVRATDIAVDLDGVKDLRLEKKKYVLTSRPAKHAVARFDDAMYPIISNVINNVPGDALALAEKRYVVKFKTRLNRIERETQFLSARDKLDLALGALRKKLHKLIRGKRVS